MRITMKRKRYLCEHGKALEVGETYRKWWAKNRDEISALMKSVGADPTTARLCQYTDKLLALRFPHRASPPDGWTKPDGEGWSRPKKTKANKELREKHFAEQRGIVKNGEAIQAVIDAIGAPERYKPASTETTSYGWRNVGDIMFRPSVCLEWPDLAGPICVLLPDIEAERKRCERKGYEVGDQLDWEPIEGLRQITADEWDLIVAQHKVDKANAAA